MTLYTAQKPIVSSKPTDPMNGIIRVTFSDITLALSLTDASWLATNLQMEIRKVERDYPCGLIDDVRTHLDDPE